MRAAFVFVLAALPAQAPPASERITADCVERATTHVLVRKDVFVRLDAAEQNLQKAEALLKQAQADLIALKAAADELQRQKTALLEHQARLVEHQASVQAYTTKLQDAYAACAGTGTSIVHATSDALGAAWEAVDAPLGFAAGAGMCVGIAWGLTQATK
jgi:hypothetical protein